MTHVAPVMPQNVSRAREFFSFEIDMPRAIYYMPYLGTFDFFFLNSRMTSIFCFCED